MKNIEKKTVTVLSPDIGDEDLVIFSRDGHYNRIAVRIPGYGDETTQYRSMALGNLGAVVFEEFKQATLSDLIIAMLDAGWTARVTSDRRAATCCL